MDKIFIVPHSHYDAEVFKTREEYLEWGFSIIIEALRMLKQHKEYRFVLDQTAYIKPFLDNYPEFRETFLEMVKSGRLDIVCGMYVMPDVNIPSGESLIRQISLGKEYCRTELGVDVRTGWMIDSFGHHPQMPQIMKKSGFDYYAFARVADEKNSEFLWEGLDGSLILTHWMAHHYTVFWDSPKDIEGFSQFVEQRYRALKEYAVTGNIMAPEGHDFNNPVEHTPVMVSSYNQKTDRLADLKLATPSEFFKVIENNSDKLDTVTSDNNPVFQGCYSARIELKQWNRHMENLLFTTELFNALSDKPASRGRADNINEAWEPVLFNQFHDVICGCHVDKVFNNAVARYRHSEFIAGSTFKLDIDNILEQIDTRGEGVPVIVFNQLNWERTDKVEAAIGFDETDIFDVNLVDSSNKSIPFQLDDVVRYSSGGIKQAKVVFVASIPSMGYEVFRVLAGAQNPGEEKIKNDKCCTSDEVCDGILENEYYRIKIDVLTGAITSIILKENGEEFINPELPLGNMLVKDQDSGDFWEIDSPLNGYATKPVNKVYPMPVKGEGKLSVEHGGSGSIEEGSIRKDFRFIQKSSYGEFTTNVSLYSGLGRIEIESHLVNKEGNVRYRVAFPSNIKNGRITYEIPFGSLERPEGELPAQNWIDYSDAHKGLGLLNCGLPANAVVGDTLMLSILKATSFVQYGNIGGFDSSAPSAGGFEIGREHKFRYSLVPHEGDWKDAELYKHGFEINNPLIVCKSAVKQGALEPRKSFINLDKSNVIITCVKRKDNSIIIRLYEAAGRETDCVRLELYRNIKSAAEVNLIEDKISGSPEITVQNGNQMAFDIKPFEIKTLKLEIQ